MSQETVSLGLLAFTSFCFLTPDPTPVMAVTALPLILHLGDSLSLSRLLAVAFPILLCSTTLNSLSTTLPLLSSKVQVLLLQATFSAATSLVIVATVLAHRYLKRLNAVREPATSAWAFGALWSTAWVIWEQISPLGRLGVPSPHLASARYLLPVLQYFGHPGVDFLVGVSAYTTYESIRRAYSRLEPLLPNSFRRLGESTTLLIDADERSPLIPRTTDDGIDRDARKGGMWPLVAVVVGCYGLLAALPQAPLLSLADGFERTTPFSISCLQPTTWGAGHTQLYTLVRLSETLASQSKLIVWPENAFLAPTDADREQAIERVHLDVAKRYGVWVAMGVDSHGGGRNEQSARRRNEVILVGPDRVVGAYEKQRLVPLVESYSIEHGETEVPAWTIALPPPPHVPKTEWSPASPHKREIALLPLICLDSFHPTLVPTPPENGILMIPALSPALPLSSHLLSAAQDLSAMHRMPSILCSASSERHPGAGISAVIDAEGRIVYVQRGGESFTVKLPLAHGSRRRTGWQILGTKGVLGLQWGAYAVVVFLQKVDREWTAEQWRRVRHRLQSTFVARRLGWSQENRGVDLL